MNFQNDLIAFLEEPVSYKGHEVARIGRACYDFLENLPEDLSTLLDDEGLINHEYREHAVKKMQEDIPQVGWIGNGESNFYIFCETVDGLVVIQTGSDSPLGYYWRYAEIIRK